MTTNQSVTLAIGLLSCGLTIYSLRTGKVWGKYETVTRNDSPIGYWFYVTLYGSLGLICVISALTFFP